MEGKSGASSRENHWKSVAKVQVNLVLVEPLLESVEWVGDTIKLREVPKGLYTKRGSKEARLRPRPLIE
jgi:hypothetical protein